MVTAVVLAFHLSLVPTLTDMAAMQGEWNLKASTDGKSVEGFPNGTRVLIKGNQIISLSKNEKERGAFVESDYPYDLNRFGIDPNSKPKKIGIYWCEGIYELNGDKMRFCLRYHGQGVEGEAARLWKAPVDFTVREGQHHILWSFERIKKK